MKLIASVIKSGRIYYFVIGIFILLAASVIYFLYIRQRTQTPVFVYLSILRQSVVSAPVNAPNSWVPYWIDESVSVGDRESNPFGSVSSEIIEKESFEAPFYGRYVYLLVRMKSSRDRSGMLLYKNKPLSAGGIVNLTFSKVQIQGYVFDVSLEKPVRIIKTVRIQVKGRDFEPAVADAIRIGSEIKNSKGEILARVVDKKVTPAEVRVDTASGQAMTSYDQRKRDIEATVDVIVKDINGLYFFMETQKVKVYENIFLPFPEIGNLTLPIMRIVSEKPGNIQ